MKISKKTREEAIRICAIAASTPDPSPDVIRWQLTDEIADDLYIGFAAANLACTVRNYCRRTLDWPGCDAEAECLLREGWTP